jgi:hypothetical protein
MNKKTKKVEKSISRTAGEVIGTIGQGIATGTDKLVEAAHVVADAFSKEKKLVTKKAKKPTKKAVPKKKTVKKAVKKIAKKVSKKITKKK